MLVAIYFLGRNVYSDHSVFQLVCFFLLSWKSFLDILDTRSLSSQLVSSVVQLCPTLCDPMNCSTLGFPVHHQLPELAQTHVYWVSVAIQPSYPLSSPSPPAFSLSQHQGLIKWWFSDIFSFSLSWLCNPGYSFFLLLVILVSYIRNHCQIQGHGFFRDFYSFGSYMLNLQTIWVNFCV